MKLEFVLFFGVVMFLTGISIVLPRTITLKKRLTRLRESQAHAWKFIECYPLPTIPESLRQYATRQIDHLLGVESPSRVHLDVEDIDDVELEEAEVARLAEAEAVG